MATNSTSSFAAAGPLRWRRDHVRPDSTVGPFFAYGLTPDLYGHHAYVDSNMVTDAMVTDATAGERIRIEGTVTDGAGAPVRDALVEIWQADAYGFYHHPADCRSGARDPHFSGFGRCGTNEDGQFSFITVKPGSDRESAPHINVIVFSRGLLLHAFTRIYFADHIDANERNAVPPLVDPKRQHTLIARRGNGPFSSIYRCDIHLQGDKETVFFDV